MKKVLVLGAGIVGAQNVRNLQYARDQLTVADISEKAIHKLHKEGITCDFEQIDLINEKERLQRLARKQDLIVSALPYKIATQVLASVITARQSMNIVDVSFVEAPLELHRLAEEWGAMVVVDMGAAPGIPHLILGHEMSRMDVKRFTCLMGCIPLVPRPPLYHSILFELETLVAEYVRPVVVVEDGNVVTKEALSDPQLLYCDQLGQDLDARNTDGLRSLIDTMGDKVPFMVEKSIRWPEHWKALERLIDVNASSSAELTAMFSEHCRLRPEDDDLTVAEIDVVGTEEGVVYRLFDGRDPVTRVTSAAKVTSAPLCAIAQLVLDGHFFRTGVIPPEEIGATPGLFEKILQYHEEQGIFWKRSHWSINS